MRTDKKSEFLKALKRDRVEEEHEDENAGKEKVTFFVPVVDPTVMGFRLKVTYVFFSSNQLLKCGLGSLDAGRDLPLDEFALNAFSTES